MKELFVDPCMSFLGCVVQAERDLFGLLAGGVRREYEDAIGDALGDYRSSQPAIVLQVLAELAEHGDPFPTIRGGGLFEQRRARMVVLDAQIGRASCRE